MPQSKYTPERLVFTAPNIDDYRELPPNDHQFDSWIASYGNAIQSKDPETALLSIGREIYGWLNGPDHFFDRMMDELDQPPYIGYSQRCGNRIRYLSPLKKGIKNQ